MYRLETAYGTVLNPRFVQRIERHRGTDGMYRFTAFTADGEHYDLAPVCADFDAFADAFAEIVPANGGSVLLAWPGDAAARIEEWPIIAWRITGSPRGGAHMPIIAEGEIEKLEGLLGWAILLPDDRCSMPGYCRWQNREAFEAAMREPNASHRQRSGAATGGR